ncbi:MotA/TolQ/ExbB proton channel family protein [Crocinitomicaceae bacterium CZZ-1]|uniref:MotA/TolQ/ExbB proton channel family protein n=1 Tax=Taishania pollutisoli TaxID=2766479 RepID=A0A8J6P640_9FLAO|nr:MotA/TolQ/ExbB proton channel family protein [Taishania pollutisoli]MBC9812557.1 MotA/TolQ/ExbB proton channel family protein [Taishania pollutisoli]NGF74531.1 MotA/TolQ/ExbB proton channel family protein [Fluviicola sp. SGL-29]
MSSRKTAGGFSALVGAIAIVIALVIGIVIYKYILGNPANFIDNNPENEPLQGNYLGIVYKGGFIVPMLIAVNITVLIYMFERFITLSIAKGKGNLNAFVTKLKDLLASGNIEEAKEACETQKGSLANVVAAGLEKYELMANDTTLDKEQKIESIKKELEEATSLELPMLSKNLPVLSTIASISVLVGLIGTVMGMIKSFGAMSHGAPDTAQLAAGISEALINTVLGISGSCLAIIFYNFFNTKVDQMTHSMDEASFTIVQDFSKSVK